MKKIILLYISCLTLSVFAQRKLTIEEATYGAYTTFSVENLNGLQWRDNENFTYLSKDYQSLMHRNASGRESETPFLTKSALENSIKKFISDETITLNIFPYDYKWMDNNTLHFNVNGKEKKYVICYDIQNQVVKKSFELHSKAKNEIMSEKSNYVAWLEDNNIRISTSDGKMIEVTNDSEGIVNGSENTHRQEFGIDKGMWFSPDGSKLLYYRKDETMVTDYPLTDFSTRIATIKNTKYPMSGMTSEEVTLVVYDIATKNKTVLNTGTPKEQFLTMVTWAPSGNEIYVGVLNREQDHLKLNVYNSKTGAFIKTLFEEKSSVYVEPQHPLYFNPENAKQFVVSSDRDGYRKLYLYDTDGKMLQKLGNQSSVFNDFLGFHKGEVYYTAKTNRGLETQLFKSELKNGKTTQLTKKPGTHNVVLNSDKSLFIDSFEDINTPNEIRIENTKKGTSAPVLTAKNPYNGVVELPKMELITLKSADQTTDLNARIIYPSNFDATKKYPVMVYVYGGPHAQLINNSWLGGASLFDYYMAEQGYVVFTLDNRGSAHRGRDFEQVIHRQLGQAEMADQMKGIEYLKSKSFVDADRIGVYGWSFGGFMTTSLLLNQPEIFKVGVAGGPVIDWKWYEVMYGERYMDTPEENPEGYAKTSLLDKVNKLQGRLLLIHGAQDPVVVQQHSMEFIEACIKAGKQVDYFLYPTHEHNVRGRDRVHLNQKIADYFEVYLK